jgi:hypothetical protein
MLMLTCTSCPLAVRPHKFCGSGEPPEAGVAGVVLGPGGGPSPPVPGIPPDPGVAPGVLAPIGGPGCRPGPGAAPPMLGSIG